MFLGTYSPRLDDKGRLILPAKFREELAAGLVVSRGEDRCLVVYPAATWEQVTGRLTDAQISTKALREYSRVLFANASDEIPDRQGRITIPPPLREYARLERECTVIGHNQRVEIWEPSAWDTYLAAGEENFANSDMGVHPGQV